MKPRKKILLGIAAIFAAMQFFRPEKNLSDKPVEGFDYWSEATLEPNRVAGDIKIWRILRAACYDCHSDRTRYPWYSEIEPVGWWLAVHVIDGKTALNFSQFRILSAQDASHLLDASVDAINHGTMPPASYRLLHAEARLSEADKILLTAWLQGLSEKISAAK
jgi:hypothetical protein